MNDGDVSYEPIGVKQILREMKNTAEVLVDLAFCAVLFDDRDVAEQALALEERMDLLQLRARMSLLMAARNPDDAEALAPVLGVVGAAEKISDAGGDIASVVLDERGVPPALRAALPEALETVVTARIAADSTLAGQTLGERNLETETGVRVVAVRRGDEWLLDPGRETGLYAEDVTVLRGSETAIGTVHQEATGEAYVPPSPPGDPEESLDRAVDAIVHLKDISELAVDLAYGSVLFEGEDVAETVFELEAEADALQERFEVWVLEAAASAAEPASLRGLLRLASGTETISDAALEISEGVLRGLGTHPVLSEAVEESDEVIARVTVEPESALDETTLGERAVGTETGMRVVAIKRSDEAAAPGRGWTVSPEATTELQAGDTLIAKGTGGGADRLRSLAS